MKKLRYLTLILITLFLFNSNHLLGQQTPYYGLEGWAATTHGGKGGRIIRVTNLNVSGAGSLADALKSSGVRIVVFEVGGVINLQGNTISISDPFITVAGQTAPSPGITVVNGTISIRTHDVILQHIRARVGAGGHEVGQWEPDGPSTISASNVVIDHCSISWAVDENCSASGPRFNGNTPSEWRANTSHDVTISNNLIAEGLSNATHTKGEHSKGSLIHDNATNIAILKNLYISNRQRNPLFKGGACGVVVNNYIYNPGNMAIRYALVPSEWEGYTWQTGRMSIVGNVLQYGPNTSNIPLMRATGGACEIYFDDNIAKNRSGENVQIYSGDGTNIVGQPPIWNENIQSMNATEVKNYVVGHAGARPWDRDEVDQRLINELLTGTGQVIDYETEVGGYPTTTPMNAPFQAENWNMELMIQKHAGLILTTPVVGDTISQNTTFIVQVDTGSFSKEIEFLELLVNGESAGKRMAIPYQWTVNTDVVGSDELVVVAGVKNGRLWVSSTLNKEVVAGSGTGFLDNNSSDHFKLYNFPNPFSTQTTIHYQMAHSGHVQLRLFNDSGKMIADHALGNQLAGIHRWNWDAGNLPPGTYLLLLKVGEQLFQHKLSLCK